MGMEENEMNQKAESSANGDDVAALNAALEQANAKAGENWDLYIRTQAEMQNLKRRAERDLEQAHKFGLEKFVNELLPVIDSLEMGLAAAREASSAEKLIEGTELTLRMLRSATEKFGVKAIDPAGAPFNPEWHQAISMQESASAAPNTVLHVVQKGYLLSDRLIRPALVVVAKAEQGAPNAPPSIDERA
jgi:molecular chaperone GrpE